jgi:hypothetical protein
VVVDYGDVVVSSPDQRTYYSLEKFGTAGGLSCEVRSLGPPNAPPQEIRR